MEEVIRRREVFGGRVDGEDARCGNGLGDGEPPEGYVRESADWEGFPVGE